MIKEISSLRFSIAFEHCVDFEKRKTSISLTGFSRAVCKYVFGLCPEIIGNIHNIEYEKIVEIEAGVLCRIAVITVAKDKNFFYFYVYTEAHPDSRHENWRVVGRSILFSSDFLYKIPNYDTEMIWIK